MAIFKCKMCGGNLEVREGTTISQCEYCGSIQTVPVLDNEKKITLFTRANRLRNSCEFDKAFGVYESIVTEFPEEAEAYWGLILCKYGIEYVDDPKTDKKIPTCHRSSFDSVMDDSNFEMVMEYSDAVSRRIYREEAKAIEALRISIIEVSSKEAPYDIFICYKETDASGDRTIDSVIAQDVYEALTEKGYRVFFSRITLEDKLGQEYEPYIFAALNSAKIMLAFGTDYEYYNAVWVKNEWSRFLSLITKGEKKTLIPCYKGIDAYDLPKEFARLQAQDMGKVGAIQDLLRGIEKILGKKTAVTVDNPLVKRGYLYLEDKDYTKAANYFENALDEDPENGEAYLGKVFAHLHVQNLESLKQLPVALHSMPDFQKAVRFASGSLKERLTAIAEANTAQTTANAALIQNILKGSAAELIRLAPSLQQVTKSLPASAYKDTFGVDATIINHILAEYEVYSLLKKSTLPLNTSALRKASQRIFNLSDQDLREIMVHLNHAGFIVFENRKFSFLTDAFRQSKNDEYHAHVQKSIDELTFKLNTDKQRLETLPTLIDAQKKLYDFRLSAYNEALVQSKQQQQSFLNVVESETQQKNELQNQLNTLASARSSLGLFQGKRKKELTTQIELLQDKLNALDISIKNNSAQAQNITHPSNMAKEIQQNIQDLQDEQKLLPTRIHKMQQELAKLYNDRDHYEWMPEKINLDFSEQEVYKFRMPVEDIFTITGRGTVVTGRVSQGTVHIKDNVEILHTNGTSTPTIIKGIELFRKTLDYATEGDNAGLILAGIDTSQVNRGDLIIIR